MALGLALHNLEDVERAETLNSLFLLVNVLLENEWEVINHVPNQVGLFKYVKEWYQFAANALEHFLIIYLSVYQLRKRYLVVFGICVLLLVST